ncbi:MAG: hypothetical protein JO002_01760, partial [Burkholderiaceae bacterium]|nr:hypothetical protein [Burkholderiaceae bacterium]
MSFQLKSIPLAIAQIAAGGALSLMAVSPVMAQSAPADQQPVQQITVTGSMIKRINAESAEAITIIKSETLKDMGITTVEQA